MTRFTAASLEYLLSVRLFRIDKRIFGQTVKLEARLDTATGR